MYDAIIIGAGSGGYACAIRIAQMGGKPLIIEKDKIGGCCTNRGCIPTKALLKSAKFFHDIKNASRLGIKIENPSLDNNAVFKRVDRVVSTTSKGIEQLLKSYDIEIVKGYATITNSNTVNVNSENFETKNIVIATGSTPRSIPGVEEDDFVINSDSFFDLKEIPGSMVIIGGGAIGVEFANILSFFGSKVTIVEMMDHIVPTEDVEISCELEKIFKRYGISVFTKSKINISEGKVTVESNENTSIIEPDKVLVAIGRKPVFNVDELEILGVNFSTHGIYVNDQLKTNINNIYAIGDVTGKYQLAHVAIRQGIIAAQNIMGKESTINYEAVPTCIYTKPEIGSIGVRSQDETSLAVGKSPFIANAKARTDEEKDGFIKLLSKDNKIVGMHIIGGTATEFLGEGSVILNSKLNLDTLAEAIHPHPTFSESISEAIEDIKGCAINIPKKND